MRNANLHFFLLLAAALGPVAGVPAAQPVPPQIQNLVAAQRPGTMFVDITYDLIDPDSRQVYILVECSTNNGASFGVPIRSLTGDVGSVTPGTGKKIAWNAWNDWAGKYTANAKVRLVADDTTSVIPLPPADAPATNLVWIPSGAFYMRGNPLGVPGTQYGPDVGMNVYLTRGFWMGKFEVTQAEFQQIMATNPSYFKGSPNLPADSVTWDKAVQYCRNLTVREQTAGRLPAGWSYRLPTEAEWEHAARSGTTAAYSFGDDPNLTRLGFYAWYKANSDGQSHEVGLKGPNHWGLYDMMGNVWEWCSDWYGVLPGGNVTDPKGPPSGVYRVVRGAGWDVDGIYCVLSRRVPFGPSETGIHNVGFRVILAPSP